MDSTFGIALYDPNYKFDKEDSVDKLRNKYIWRYSINDIYVNYDKFVNEDNTVIYGSLGCLLYGGVYIFTKDEIVEIINNSAEIVKRNFDFSILTSDKYFFVWEDWS